MNKKIMLGIFFGIILMGNAKKTEKQGYSPSVKFSNWRSIEKDGKY